MLTNSTVAWCSPSAFISGAVASNAGMAFFVVWRVWQAD